MILAIILVLIVVGSVVFHFLNPWTLTELASQWGSMDTMLHVSFLITGIVFVAVTLFMAVAIIRYRHREGQRARFQPDNRKLEWWLIGATTVGIVALLAPGLVVYSDFTRVPSNAMEVEVFGEQWRYSYRYPGADGVLGYADIRHIGPGNPLGLNPNDDAAMDDVVIHGDALRLPVDRPVRLVMRSKDVIHGFFVPQFRAKMDMVPGMVTHFWFTPTRTGRFEVLCTQHCGTGHYNMRGHVEVMERQEFDAWLREQPTFRESLAAADNGERPDDPVEFGRQLADGEGCLACHSVDGGRRVGPTWLNLYGSEVTLADGSTVAADEAYLRRSIEDPSAQITAGYSPVMPAYSFDEEEMDALLAFIRSLSEQAREE